MSRLAIAAQVIAYFVTHDRWEYLFAALVLTLVGLLFVVALASPAAPFLYPLI